ncbi:ribosomal protein S18-alanine N-acetyltransferase [bacterium]|nr:ribosomal protein S18-alanine N-acetyltransferase [bacterium]
MKIEKWRESELPHYAEMEREIFGEITFFSAFPLPKQRHCFAVDGGYALIDFVGDEAELLQIGVLPLFRQRGVGKVLLAEVVHYLNMKGVSRFFLEVRDSNRAALALYKSYGFKQIGRRSGYYSNPKEDALVFALNL